MIKTCYFYSIPLSKISFVANKLCHFHNSVTPILHNSECIIRNSSQFSCILSSLSFSSAFQISLFIYHCMCSSCCSFKSFIKSSISDISLGSIASFFNFKNCLCSIRLDCDGGDVWNFHVWNSATFKTDSHVKMETFYIVIISIICLDLEGMGS